MIIFLILSSIFSFNISNALWPSRTSTISFTTTMGPLNSQQLKNDLDSDGTLDWVNETKKAFNRWLQVNGVDFTLNFADNDCGSSCRLGNGENEIYWINPADANFTYPDQALGITFRYQDSYRWREADIIINKNFDITLTPGAQDSSHRGFCILDSNSGGGPYTGCYDFPSVITHEIGHFFGLEHPSEDPNLDESDYRKHQTMYYSVSYGNTLLPLHEDDIDAIYCLYPEGEDSLKVDECCNNQNPLLRPSTCSHSFSEEISKSLVTKETGGCGSIHTPVDSANKNILFILLLAISPILLLALLRGLI